MVEDFLYGANRKTGHDGERGEGMAEGMCVERESRFIYIPADCACETVRFDNSEWEFRIGAV